MRETERNLYKNKEATHRENEMMLKKLGRSRIRTSESDKNQALAKLAGIDIPSTSEHLPDKKKQRGREKSRAERNRVKVGGMEMERVGEKSKRSRILLSRSRSRSPIKKKQKKKPETATGSGGKWAHDKFQETLNSPEKLEHSPAFGSHWSQIRSERSKERDRRSDSSGSSRSRSSRRRSHSSSSRSSDSGSSDSDRRSRRKHKRRRHHSSSSSVSVSSNSSEELRQQIRRHKATRPPIEEEEPEKTNQDSQDSAHTSKEGQDKEEVSMGLSGNLLKDTNTVNGVVVRYSEPAEARKPKTKWRLYVFKGNEELPILYVHRQSAYLLGRDRKVADIPLDHPSCSKQHAVIQYRLMPFTRPNGTTGKKVTAYIVDMNSANGTFINNEKVESQKYVEVKERDVLKFGFSSREYVMLHDQCKDDAEDDPGLD